MVSGHLVTALIAKQKVHNASLLFLLVASMLPDLLWLIFHYLGLEPTGPTDIFDTSVQNLSVNMTYSHDLLPQVFWIGLTFIVGKALYKDSKIALTGAVLVLGHFLLDLLSGYPHFVFDTDSQQIGFGLYLSNVYLAIGIEAVFTALLLFHFFNTEKKQGVNRSLKNHLSLTGVFVFGIVFILSIANYSLREVLNIPLINLGFNTTVMGLLITFSLMIIAINVFARKK